MRRLIGITVLTLGVLAACTSYAGEASASSTAATGETQRMQTAVAELKKKAEANDVKAMVDLGDHYWIGKGVPQDYVEAAKWWRKAADCGDAEAMQLLGSLYVEGCGVSKSDVNAYMWFSLAASKNDKYAVDRDNMSAHMTPEQIAEAPQPRRLTVGH